MEDRTRVLGLRSHFPRHLLMVFAVNLAMSADSDGIVEDKSCLGRIGLLLVMAA